MSEESVISKKMFKVKIIFIFNNDITTIQSTAEDKMEDICLQYSTKINKNMKSLIFLYEEKELNFESYFKEIANSKDIENKEIKIFVKLKNNDKAFNNNNLLLNIKSNYFTKFLFSHLEENVKLKIIKYNKTMKNMIDIKLINYKFLSKRYIILEDENKGKEYDGQTDNLIYEGEYLNGKRNGKGKEYDENKLIFEGEYLNGKRNGKGKEYYYNGKLKFEGEYLNEEKIKGKFYDKNGNKYYDLENQNGNIKEYDNEGYLFCEYEYINGKKNGKAKEYGFDEVLIFEGEYLNGKRNGKGKEYYDNGEIKFEGEYLNGKRNGKGKEYNSEEQLIFEGEFTNGKKWNGKGYDNSNNVIYELKNGKGLIKEFTFFGSTIEGEYLNGEYNGKRKDYFGDKIMFDGEYLYDSIFKGKLYINGILEYEGEYLFDKKWNGKGFDEDGNIIYEVVNGNGKVKEYYPNEVLLFEGEYLNGKRNGEGKEYDIVGNLVYEGEYLNGKRNGKGVEYYSDGEIEFEGEYLNGERKENENEKEKEKEDDSD